MPIAGFLFGKNVSKSQDASVKMSAPVKKKIEAVVKFIFTLLLTLLTTSVIGIFSHDIHEFFLCRKCGMEIVDMSKLVNVPSKLALRQRNDTYGKKSGVLIQLFKNPHGVMFEVIGATEANVYRASGETSGDTWYPGYNWKILGCPRCKTHIGWEYIPADKTDTSLSAFFGLVLSSLLYENEADSLLVLPKAYRS